MKSKYINCIKIKDSSIKKFEPYYEVDIEMDGNDGDYVYKKIKFTKSEWEKMPDIFFLILMYIYDFGKNFEDSEISDIIINVTSTYGLLLMDCHSFTDICITYYNEKHEEHLCQIEDIYTISEDYEERIKIIKEAYQKASREDGIF